MEAVRTGRGQGRTLWATGRTGEITLREGGDPGGLWAEEALVVINDNTSLVHVHVLVQNPSPTSIQSTFLLPTSGPLPKDTSTS